MRLRVVVGAVQALACTVSIAQGTADSGDEALAAFEEALRAAPAVRPGSAADAGTDRPGAGPVADLVAGPVAGPVADPEANPEADPEADPEAAPEATPEAGRVPGPCVGLAFAPMDVPRMPPPERVPVAGEMPEAQESVPPQAESGGPARSAPSAGLQAAAGPATRQDAGATRWVQVSADTLDRLRGGYQTDSGLTIAFGLTRTVSVDGQVVAQTILNVPAAGGLANAVGVNAVGVNAVGVNAAAANAFAATAGGAALLPASSGTRVSLVPLAGGGTATIVQNSANNQTLQTQTAINATVSGLQTMRALSLQSALRAVLINAIPR
jgi:hypothetical protein